LPKKQGLSRGLWVPIWVGNRQKKAFNGPFHLQRAITTKRPTLIAAIKCTKI